MSARHPALLTKTAAPKPVISKTGAQMLPHYYVPAAATNSAFVVDSPFYPHGVVPTGNQALYFDPAGMTVPHTQSLYGGYEPVPLTSSQYSPYYNMHGPSHTQYQFRPFSGLSGWNHGKGESYTTLGQFGDLTAALMLAEGGALAYNKLTTNQFYPQRN